MNFLKTLLKPVASLRLTVALLAMSIIVVFAGTWAQIDASVWQVQRQYFHSFWCIIDFNLFLPRQQPDLSAYSRPIAAITQFLISILSHLRIPMLGGYSLIGLLLINLLAAHTVRFKVNLKRTGIILIHAGLILLICGEVVTSLVQVEQQMTIQEGETVSFGADVREAELAVIDTSPADHNNVAVVSAHQLARGGTISDPQLPCEIRIDRFYPNSEILGPFQAKGQEEIKATAGTGVGITARGVAQFSGVNASAVDQPSAYVTLSAGGRELGTYLLSVTPLPSPFPKIDEPQDLKIGDRTYQIQLRFKRYYKPYSVQLLKFSFDRYTGTNTPKNFSSRVRLIDPETSQDREVLIWMNHPLRYRGETFYQADFNHVTEHGTVLQVVKNPGWLIPYISCAMVALGMLIHFGMTLVTFLTKRAANVTAPSRPASGRPKSKSPEIVEKKPGLLWPALGAIGCVIYLFSLGSPPREKTSFDLTSFSMTPISFEGRTMPLDSLARNSLRIISGRDDITEGDDTVPAIRWLADVMTGTDKARGYRIFRIDHPDIVGMLHLNASQNKFSYDDVEKHIEDLGKEYAKYDQLRRADPKNLDLYQRKILELGDHVVLFQHLSNFAALYLAPPADPNGEWETMKQAVDESNSGKKLNPAVTNVASILDAYQSGNADNFKSAINAHLGWVSSIHPATMDRVSWEVLFNRVDPFYACTGLYVIIFVLVAISWMFNLPTVQRTAFWILVVTWVFHTLGLVARIYIQGRPPVTNLYSSAIFIAWAAVLLCVGLEIVFRNGVATAAGCAVAFPSLIIAHYLALDPRLTPNGDTMEMLQAVLDTNIWLATHVVVVTLGYAATFLAGLLAVIYVLRGVFLPSTETTTPARTPVFGGLLNLLMRIPLKTLAKLVYGVICFAMLFSFVGTVLGGIWADQSWGRFWGWDPKENGAVLIVFWNALILHARWGGLVRDRGMAMLAIFGNAVTSWSWFGTNMLGVGLHSYGFMQSAVLWLVTFVLMQLALIGIGSIPTRWWRCNRTEQVAEDEKIPLPVGATA